MILNDAQIRERLADKSLVCTPIDDRAIQPASIDLTLGPLLYAWPPYVVRDPRVDQSGLWLPVPIDECWIATSNEEGHVARGWILRPGIRYLGVTEQEIRLPADLSGQLAARSSWGRDGLAVIQGPAGFLDASYHGRPTLELSVVGSALVMRPGDSCVQLVLTRMAAPACRPYGHRDRRSRYQGDLVPTPARLEA